MSSDEELTAYLAHVERSAEMGIEANKQALTNHLDNSALVIANIAAMKNLENDELIKLALEHPT